MGIRYLHRDDPAFPLKRGKDRIDQAPERISLLGSLNLLKENKTAFFCSSKCTSDIISKTRDLATRWRDGGITVISGFHSPVEKECLAVLLGGRQPVIVCPARSIETMRVRAEFRAPLAEGRLLFVSPFVSKERRMTARTASIRNRFAAAMADVVFVAHAEGGGKIEVLCRELAARNRALKTFASDSNANLLTLGAKPIIP